MKAIKTGLIIGGALILAASAVFASDNAMLALVASNVVSHGEAQLARFKKGQKPVVPKMPCVAKRKHKESTQG